MKKLWQIKKLWKKVVAFCVGVPVILAALYGVWGLVVKVDTRWEKAEAAAEQRKATEQKFEKIERILQYSTLGDLRRELRALEIDAGKRKLTDREQERLGELKDQIKDLEDGLKK